ncbi:MAG: anti-sigma factor, partial [Chloroflexi bacterium]|nr:anti-sigma factor [Chloroflexota bacterium]
MIQDQIYDIFRENIPAYALDALDVEDARALESHLQTCASCRTELAEYRALSETLLLMTPAKTPPAALRRRLQGQLQSTQKRSSPLFVWSFNQLALGLTLIILLALNISSYLQIRSLQKQQVQLASQLENEQAAIAMLAYPNTESLPIKADNISGTLLVDKNRNTAMILVWNLPQLDSTQTYQAWLIDPQGKRTDAGIFRPQPGQPYTSQSIFS